MSVTFPVILSYSVNALELIAAITAFIHYKKYINSTEKYFLPFLWFTFFVDAILGPVVGDFLNMDNIWIFYGYTGISFLFYFYWYHKILNNAKQKKITIIFSIIFFTFYVYNGRIIEFHEQSFIVGAFFILILTGFHLYQLSNADYTVKIKYKLSFWITIALVLFNIGMIPFILLSKHFNVRVFTTAFALILFFLNVILYGCYTIGFIWTKTKYNHF